MNKARHGNVCLHITIQQHKSPFKASFGANTLRKTSPFLAILPLIASPVFAQTTPAPVPDLEDVMPESLVNAASTGTATQSFTPEDFARFTPRTALDMVLQIPGFQIEAQDNSQRGFGQATGNVLINGQRLSGKSNDAVEALGRIPTASVIRIEVQDGAQLDIPGLSGQVVNVITNQTAGGISGAWTAETVFRDNLDPSFLNGTLSLSGKYKKLDWTVSLENENPRRGNAGIENVFDGNGTLIEVRDEETRFANEEPRGQLALTWRPDSGAIANLNLSYEQGNFEGREIGFRSPVGLPDEDNLRLFNFGNDSREGEISGDYDFQFGPGRLKIIGLYNLSTSSRENEVITTLLSDGSFEGSLFTQAADEQEAIGRFEYAYSPRQGRDWQLSFEGAFNSLENVSNLFEIDQASGLIQDPDIIDDTTRVEELRGEANLTHSRRLTPKINAQASFGVEVSELSQSGPTGLTRLFVRPKGFASLAWRPSSNTTISTRIEREVGQLDFFDFVSTVNLNLDNEQAGNPDIVPQQAWLGEIEWEQRFGSYGAFTVRTFGELITDIVDQIPLSDTEEAPGNLNSAQRFGIEVNTTLRLDAIGLKGVQFELEGEARNSRLEDPLLGNFRRINRDLVSRIFTEVRYDVPSTPYALGINYNIRREARDFRLDQSTIRSNRRGNLGVFFEHKNIFGLTGIVQVRNLLNEVDVEERAVFVERRDNSPLDFFEARTRTFEPILRFELRGSF